jgi:hypothetical protein
MSKRNVMAIKNMPTRLPIIKTIVAGLLLDRFHAPQWMWGATIMLFILGWIGFTQKIANEKQVNLFPEQD